jgi:hypothetical protein
LDRYLRSAIDRDVILLEDVYVTEFGIGILIDQHVRCFEVLMGQTLRVEKGQSLKNLLHENRGQMRREFVELLEKPFN